MKKTVFTFLLILAISNTFSQVGQINGGSCKLQVYKGGITIYQWGYGFTLPEDTTYLCPGDSFQLQISCGPISSCCGSVLWQKNGVNIPNATSYIYTVIDTGTYNISSSAFGILTNVINVKRCTSTSIKQITYLNQQVNIYPNPNNGIFVVEPNNNTKQTLQLYDVNGKLLLSQTINGKTTIDTSSLIEGIYNISLTSSKGIINNRLVIVK